MIDSGGLQCHVWWPVGRWEYFDNQFRFFFSTWILWRWFVDGNRDRYRHRSNDIAALWVEVNDDRVG